MKIISCWLSSLVVCLSTFAPVPAQQTDWFFVALTSSGDVVSIDRNFIRSANGITRVWQKSISPDETYAISLGEWNCSMKKFRYVQTAMYDKNGTIIAGSDQPSKWRYFVPESTGMLLYLNICDEKLNVSSNTEKDEEFTSLFAQITVRKANLRSEDDSDSEIIREVAFGEKLVLVSKKPAGVWYQVVDSRTNSRGWLNGNTFKMVNAGRTGKKIKKNRGK